MTRDTGPLTRRESEVVRLIGQGWNNVEIAERLAVSRRTIESHIYNIGAKIGTNSIFTIRRAAIEMYIQCEVERRLAAHLPGGGPIL